MSNPWKGAEIAAAAAGNLLGLVLVLLAFERSGERLTLNDQVGLLNLAVLGIILAGAANAVLLVLGRMRLRVKLVGVRAALVAAYGDDPRVKPGTAATGHDVIVVGGPRRYRHRPQCQMVAGKAVAEVAGDDGATPAACGLCHR